MSSNDSSIPGSEQLPDESEGPTIHRLAPQFILDNHARERYGGQLDAATMFIDVSGFSAMVDSLMSHGQHGAEVAANIMRAVLDPAIETVYAHGGMVVSKAGDAVTAVFEAEDGQEGLRKAALAALAAAWRVQQHIAGATRHDSPYGTFTMGAKVGLAAGEATWGIVRSEDDSRAMYYFRGQAIDDCAQAEHHAVSGDIIATEGFAAILADVINGEARENHVRVLAVQGQLPDPQPIDATETDLALMGRYFPPMVVIQEFSGEFRWVVNVFVTLPTVRTDVQLESFMQIIFELQERYGGFLNRLDFGDKGANLLLFWGAPTSHENDIQRSLEFILDLQARTSIPVSTGISYRIAHAGTMGGAMAEEYTCYGRGVNLAARLMTAAPRGETWVDEAVATRVGRLFELEPLGEMSFKGFTEKQPVFLLLDKAEAGDEFFRWPLVGRQTELKELADFIAPILEGTTAGVIMLQGEAGMGKSRLIHAVRTSEQVEAAGVRWALAQADQTLRDSLNPFHYWLSRYFGQSRTQVDSLNKRNFNRRLDNLVAETEDSALAAELDRVRSFLGALLDLRWPDSLYEEVDAQARHENTLDGLLTLIKAESLRQPLVLQIEDAHWLDSDSLDLLARLSRNLDGYAVAVLVSLRSEQMTEAAGQRLLELAEEFSWQRFILGRLSRQDLASLAENVLGQPASPDLLTMLESRAEGNPFFAEQFLLYMQEQERLETTGEGAAGLRRLGDTAIPADVQALLTARIDMLTAGIRATVQTASVVGREFEVWLLSQMMRNDPLIPDNVAAAERAAIWQCITEFRFIFKHALVRDAAYHMLIHRRRRMLHRMAAEAIESRFADELAPHYVALAFHYEQADLAEPALRYLQLAGKVAADDYQNQQAIDLLTRALPLAEDTGTQLDLRIQRADIYFRIGDRQRQEEDLQAARQLATDLAIPARQAEVELRLANLERLLSNYDRAEEHIAVGLEKAREAGDHAAEARAQLLQGMILFNTGNHSDAADFFTSARELAFSANNQTIAAEAIYLLGNSALMERAYSRARETYDEALALYRTVSERRGEVNCLLMSSLIERRLGNLNEAVATYEQALAVTREIGWRHGESLILSHLGNHAFEMANYSEAENLHQRSLEINRQLGDREGQAASLDTLGLIAHRNGDPALAQERFEAALTIQRAVGYRRGQGYALTHLGDALADQGDLDAAAAAFQQALILRQELGEASPLLVDDLAGLGRVALAQGKAEDAEATGRKLWDWLSSRGPDGVEFPVLAYLTAYQIMSAAGDMEPAAEALQRGHDYLIQRAARIVDPNLRDQFLWRDPHHRALLQTWRDQGHVLETPFHD